MKKRPHRQARAILGDGDEIEVTFDKFFIGLADGGRGDVGVGSMKSR